MSQINLLKLDRVQNEAMRVILGTSKDIPTETMRFMLDLPPMQSRQRLEQVKAYFSAVDNPNNPLHKAVKDTKGSRLGRDKARMGQAEKSILQVHSLVHSFVSSSLTFRLPSILSSRISWPSNSSALTLTPESSFGLSAFLSTGLSLSVSRMLCFPLGPLPQAPHKALYYPPLCSLCILTTV